MEAARAIGGDWLFFLFASLMPIREKVQPDQMKMTL